MGSSKLRDLCVSAYPLMVELAGFTAYRNPCENASQQVASCPLPTAADTVVRVPFALRTHEETDPATRRGCPASATIRCPLAPKLAVNGVMPAEGSCTGVDERDGILYRYADDLVVMCWSRS